MSAEEHASQPGMLEVLHVYGQEAWHDDVRIVGNRAALEVLRSLIDAAIKGAGSKAARGKPFYVADGEGFGVIVYCNDADWQSPAWQQLATPYSKGYAR